MANPKGNPENLKPVLTKEEAKKRGAAGGKKSGEVRRRKRDAKQSIRLLLNMYALGNLSENLDKLGFDEEDCTNMNALMARMFQKAMSGDVAAFKALMDYGGFHPDQKLKERESRARIAAMESGGGAAGVDTEDGDSDDVLIYMPENGRDDNGSESS